LLSTADILDFGCLLFAELLFSKLVPLAKAHWSIVSVLAHASGLFISSESSHLSGPAWRPRVGRQRMMVSGTCSAMGKGRVLLRRMFAWVSRSPYWICLLAQDPQGGVLASGNGAVFSEDARLQDRNLGACMLVIRGGMMGVRLAVFCHQGRGTASPGRARGGSRRFCLEYV